MKLRKSLKIVIPVIDRKLSIYGKMNIENLLFRGVIDWIEDVCVEVLGGCDEDVTDCCLEYIQIKYGNKHPLRKFLK
jgi:hypothetical protein